MRALPALLLASASLTSTAAWAAGCPVPDLDTRGMQAQLDGVEQAIDAADLAGARGTLNSLVASLPCLDTVVDRGALARLARLMAMAAFYQQDEASTVRWGLAARLADPDQPWTVPSGHPYRELVEEAEMTPVGTVEGQRFVVPEGGGVFLNGELARLPAAHAEVPYLVQLLDADARVVGAYWQDGAAFPEQVLADGAGAYGTPSWYVDGRVVAPSGNRREPREGGGGGSFPVVPVVMGGGLAITSAVTYVLAGAAEASLAEQTTPEGLTQARTTANAYVLASGLAAAGAVGFGVGGVLLSPQGVRLHWTF